MTPRQRALHALDAYLELGIGVPNTGRGRPRPVAFHERERHALRELAEAMNAWSRT